MTLAQLNYFCTACRLKSITKAAEQLYVTQPAITSAIRELEKEYQLTLMERKGRAISLTEEGKLFYKSAEALLEHARDLDRQFHDLAQQKRYVRLGVTKSVGANMYTRYFAYGLRFHPQIDVSTHSGSSAELLEELRSHRLDVILIPSQSEGKLDDLTCIPLKKIQMLYCMSKEHPLAFCESLTVSMIAEEKMISTCRDENKVYALKKLFAQHGYPDGPEVVQRFDQLNTALSMIRQNVATGFFPEEVIQGYDGIVGKPLVGSEDIFVYAVTMKNSVQKEEVKLFLNGITEFCKNAGIEK